MKQSREIKKIIASILLLVMMFTSGLTNVLAAEEVELLSSVKTATETVNVNNNEQFKMFYSVLGTAKGTIKVVDAEGNTVKTLYDAFEHKYGYYALYWNLKDSNGNYVDPGTYKIKLQFENAKGSDSAELTFKVEGLRVYNVKADKAEINGEKKENVTFYYQIDQSCAGSIGVYNSQGEKVKTIYDNFTHAKGYYKAMWNGTDDSGAVVPAGTYTIRITFKTVTKELTVKVTGTAAETTYLSSVKVDKSQIDLTAGEQVKLYYGVSEKIAGDIYITNASGEVVKNLYKQFTHSAGYYVAIWNGKDDSGNLVAGGTYTITLNFGGDQKQVQITVLNEKEEVKEKVVTSYKLEADEVNIDEKSVKLSYGVKTAAKGDIRIYNADGEEVKVIYDDVLHNAGYYSAYWNGKDSSGNLVTGGEYTIVLSFGEESYTIPVKITRNAVNTESTIKVTSVRIEKEIIDLKTDTSVKWYYGLNEAVNGTARIYNEAGEVVREFYNQTPHAAGYYAITWDLKDSSRNIVPAGNYTIQMKFEKSGTASVEETIALRVTKTYDMEVKGVWISYLEMSSILAGKTQSEFTANIKEVYAACAEKGLDTVFVQVRSHGDALYESQYYPWSKYASGTVGKNPGFDPLKIMVEQAHAYGLEIHAWINPYRLMNDNDLQNLEEDYKTKQWYNNPEYMALDSNGYWCLNPGNEEVQNLILNGVQEILEKYDVDGIHIDDYFYSNGITPETFGNTAEEARNCASALVKGLYELVHSYDGGVFGVSPAGNFSGTVPNSDLEQYTDLRTWCTVPGYLDYVVPQIYWEQDHATAPFATILDKWENLLAGSDVKLYVGLAAYKFAGQAELEEQVIIVSESEVAKGYIYFRYDNIK